MQKQIYSKRLLSLFLVFVMALSLMAPAYAAEYETAYGDSLVQPIADPIITLSTTKSVYTLEETASITVQTSEGATVYYTTDGSTPDSSGANAQTVNDGKISVSAPDRGTYPDGGIITVKAIAVVDGDVSEVDEVAISFYRASENASTDVFSLETNTGTYYFSGFLTAIDAGGDANLAGPMVLKLLKTTTESYSAGNKTSIFSQATGGLEIDLNGFDWTLDCSSVKSTYFIFAANVTITDSTATGTATDNSLTAGQWTLINGKFTVNQNGIIENVKLKQTTGGEKSTTSTSVQINGNTTVNNAEIIRDSSYASGVSAALYAKGGGSIQNSVITNTGPTGKTTPALGISGDVTIKDSVLTAVSQAVYGTAKNSTLTINGGTYTGEYLLSFNFDNSTAIIEDGVFGGDIYIKYPNTSKVEIQSGYFKNDPVNEAKSVVAPHSTRESGEDRQNASDYPGYTKYTVHHKLNSTASLQGETDGAKFIGETDAYELEDIVYTIELQPGYVVSGITLNSESKELTQDSEGYGYSIDDSKTTVTYKLRPQTAGFTIVFTIAQDFAPGENVVSIGDTDYSSLSAAINAVKDNEVITLNKDITYPTILKIEKNVAIDLNGHTLTMDVTDKVNDYDTYAVVISKGTLTVKDTSSGAAGALSFNEESSGIYIDGIGASFCLESGTVHKAGTGASFFVIECHGENGAVNISGGTVKGRIFMWAEDSKLTVESACLESAGDANNIIQSANGAVSIKNSTLYAGNTSSNGVVINCHNNSNKAALSGSETVVLDIQSSTITNNGTGAALYVAEASRGRQVIGAGTVIESPNAPAIKIMGTDVPNQYANGNLAILEGATIKSCTYAVEIETGRKYYQIAIAINGGKFSCGEDYLPISDTYYVTYPDGMVLNTEAVDGYYSLTEKTNLSGVYHTTINGEEKEFAYTYQDYDGVSDGSNNGLRQLLEQATAVYDIGNEDGIYASEVWNAFLSEYESSKRCLEDNRNANQFEINYRAANLSQALRDLESVSSLDVENLPDGSYSINVALWKKGLTFNSMANGAVDHTATLNVKDGKASLTLKFVPTFQYMLYGHLQDFYIYLGTDLNDAETYVNMGESEADAANKRAEASYADWYWGDNYSPAVEFSKDILGVDQKSERYSLPGTVIFDLPYLGTSTEKSCYWTGMNVDAMSGYAAAILRLSWSTLEAIETSSSLRVEPSDSISVLQNGTQTVTATVLGSTGYTIAATSQNNSIATATVGADGQTITIKGVSEGSTTIEITATKAGAEDLVKTIKVTVVPEGSTAVDVQNVTSSSSGESAELSGNALLTGGSDRVTVDGNTVTFNAKSEGTGITSSKVVIDAETAKALEGKTAVIQTNTGTITLDSALLAKIAAAGGKVTLSISKTDTPDSSLGQFSAAYAISLIDANGKAVDFGSGRATVAVPVSENVSWAYCIADGKRTDRAAVAMNNGTATFTVSHFSVWALSSREYEVGGGSESKFFLEDGNYYVDVYLWKEVGNEASMGDIAFRNNRKALVTVKNGKITRVQIATNPVFIDPYYSAIISFKLADGTEVTVEATGDLTTSPAGKNYTYIKLVSFDLPESAQPDIRDAVTYVPVIFYVPDTPMDAAVGEDLVARLRFEWSTATKVEDEKLNPDDDTASDTESVVLKDEKTGIVLETNTGILDKNATLSVDVLTKGSDYDFALRALSDADAKWSLYNIVTLLNGAKTDPSGAVELRIPCSNADGYVVYLINADGSKTKLNGSVQDGYFVVRARSLGLIAVGTANSGSNNDNPGNSDSPQTGDNSHLAVWFWLCLTSGAALIVLTLGRKRRNHMGE